MTLARMLDDNGRLTRWPARPADKQLVIEYLATRFAEGREYSGREVNEVLKAWHTFGDWALLRRELFERGFLARTGTGSAYWKAERTVPASGG